jgi:hypothetical protein
MHPVLGVNEGLFLASKRVLILNVSSAQNKVLRFRGIHDPSLLSSTLTFPFKQMA